MALDLKIGGKSDWKYEIPHENDPEVVFYTKPLTVPEQSEMAIKFGEKTVIKRGRQEVVPADGGAILWYRFNKMVVDWKGVTVGGKEFACTPENKKLLFNEYGTSELVNGLLAAVDDLVNQETKVELGN